MINRMTNDFNPYRVLQVDELAEPEVIDAAYRRLCRKYHPDVNPSPEAHERMREINAAFEIVGDPASRRRFDEERHRSRPDAPSPPPPPEPILHVLTRSIELQTESNTARASARFDLANRGTGLLTGRITSPAAWLRINPRSFAANRLSVEIRADPSGLAVDCHFTTWVSVETNGGASRIPVSLRVNSPGNPKLQIQPARLEMGSTLHGTVDRASLKITNVGGGPLSGHIGSDQSWLKVDSAEFQGDSVVVDVTADVSTLEAGKEHNAQIRVRSNGGETAVPVRLFLATGAPRLAVSTHALDFGTLTQEQSRTLHLSVRNVGLGPITGQVLTRGDWLRVRPESFVASAIDVEVVADPSLLHGFWSAPTGSDGATVDGSIEIRTTGGTMIVPARAVLRRRRRIDGLFAPLGVRLPF